MTSAHSKISPTAKFVAYLRTFSDIPYSAEIASACGAEETFHMMVGNDQQSFLWAALLIEMRYKSMDATLLQSGLKNVIELASGVAPRGLILTEDKSYMYLETDLPDILLEKVAIAGTIIGDQPRENLKWLSVNAVSCEQFSMTEKFFRNGQIAVLNEGLLPYLNHEEKRKVAQNIHHLLSKYGGVWITPDIHSDDRMKRLVVLDPKVGEIRKMISNLTGRDIQLNSFSSIGEAEAFFTDIGFKIERYNQNELVPNLSSLNKINVEPDKLEIIQSTSHIWVMRPL